MGSVVNWVFEQILKLVEWLLPRLGVDTQLMDRAAEAFDKILNLILAAGYFIPLDVLVICVTAILAYQLGVLIFRVTIKIIDWVS